MFCKPCSKILTFNCFSPKEPPKKVWVRPGAAETPKSNSGPAKPPRRSLAVTKSPEKREASPINKREVSPTKKWEASPRKEKREVSPTKKWEASPTKAKREASPTKKHVVSEIKVMMGRAEDVGEVKLTIVPGRTTICSPSVNAMRATPDEPTATPVSVRLAAWRETTAQEETATSTPVSATMASWQKKIDKENSNAKKAGTPAKPIVHSLAGKCSPVTKGNDFKEAMARRATAVDQYTTSASPQKTSAMSPSPSKVGTATQSIHDRLEHLQGSWQSNEIAVKLKQQKRAELAQLENRWKDGVLIDDNKTNVAADSVRLLQRDVSLSVVLFYRFSARSRMALDRAFLCDEIGVVLIFPIDRPFQLLVSLCFPLSLFPSILPVNTRCSRSCFLQTCPI